MAKRKATDLSKSDLSKSDLSDDDSDLSDGTFHELFTSLKQNHENVLTYDVGLNSSVHSIDVPETIIKPKETYQNILQIVYDRICKESVEDERSKRKLLEIWSDALPDYTSTAEDECTQIKKIMQKYEVNVDTMNILKQKVDPKVLDNVDNNVFDLLKTAVQSFLILAKKNPSSVGSSEDEKYGSSSYDDSSPSEIEDEGGDKPKDMTALMEKLNQIYILKKPVEYEACKIKFKKPEENWFNRPDILETMMDKNYMILKVYMKPENYKNHVFNWKGTMKNTKNQPWFETAKYERLKIFDKKRPVPSPYIGLTLKNLNQAQEWQEGRHRTYLAYKENCHYITVYLKVDLPEYFFVKSFNHLEEFVTLLKKYTDTECTFNRNHTVTFKEEKKIASSLKTKTGS